MTEKNSIFTLNYKIICILVNEKYTYVADHHGFALIRAIFKKFGAYYFDFQRKYIAYVTILYVIDYETVVKLVSNNNRTLVHIIEHFIFLISLILCKCQMPKVF